MCDVLCESHPVLLISSSQLDRSTVDLDRSTVYLDRTVDLEERDTRNQSSRHTPVLTPRGPFVMRTRTSLMLRVRGVASG